MTDTTDADDSCKDNVDLGPATELAAEVTRPCGWWDRIANAVTNHPARVFALLATVCGLVMVFLVPPFQPPDEHPHFFRAYQISRGGLIAKRDGDKFGGQLPTSFHASAEAFIPLFYHAERKVDLGLVERMLQMPQNPEETEFVDFCNTAPYAPTTYLPAALGIAVFNLFKPSPVKLLYLTRLCCLAAYVIMLFMAIRLMPFMKWMTVLLALLPTSVAIGASVSSDVVAVGTGFLFVALCFNLAFVERDRLPRGLLAGLVVSGTVLALAKFGYAPVLPLCLIIPRKRFASTRRYWTFMLAFLVGAGILYLAWLAIVLNLHVSTTSDGGASEQIKYILSHPLDYTAILVQSYWRRQLSLPFTFICTIGHLDVTISNLHFIFYLFVLVFAALVDRTRGIRLSWPARTWIALIVAAELILIPTMLYVNSSAIGSPDIKYLTGRYAMPIAILMFAAVYNRRILTLRPRALRLFFACAAVASLAGMIISVARRYYG